jgi:hypothetical protein
MDKTKDLEKPHVKFEMPQMIDNGSIAALTAGPEGGDDESESQRCIDSPVHLVPRD